MHWMKWGTITLLLLALVGCAGLDTATEVDEPLELTLDVAESGSEIEIRFGIIRHEDVPEETLVGEWQLRDAEGDSRAASEDMLVNPESLELDGPAFIVMTWSAELDPGDYTLDWGIEGYDPVQARFSLINQDGRVILGSVSYP